MSYFLKKIFFYFNFLKKNFLAFFLYNLLFKVILFNRQFILLFQYPGRQDNVDIAASIKALAQSVHGEAIFGDLPKPRFSTQI